MPHPSCFLIAWRTPMNPRLAPSVATICAHSGFPNASRPAETATSAAPAYVFHPLMPFSSVSFSFCSSRARLPRQPVPPSLEFHVRPQAPPWLARWSLQAEPASETLRASLLCLPIGCTSPTEPHQPKCPLLVTSDVFHVPHHICRHAAQSFRERQDFFQCPLVFFRTSFLVSQSLVVRFLYRTP
uniref:Uncharacterized protein n=1 Tax=uncultured marine virus TaxID=186617 RepID=A0A0F7L421_9VIRU|nr:hypothetical protein [uncultured marine virus]